MRFSYFLAATTLICAGLWTSNPRTKDALLDRSEQTTHKIVCEQPDEALCEIVCETALPVTKLMIRGAFDLYTEKPLNFRLLTVYITRFPGVDVYALGIAGQVFMIPPKMARSSLCHELSKVTGPLN